MSEGKIQVNLGAVSFSGEGDPEWLAQQLDKVLKAAPDLAKTQPQAESKSSPDTVAAHVTASGGTVVTLAAYIKAKGGDSNQIKRFLATADWLRQRGENQLTTAKVTKALSDSHQKRLGNSADCLNQNVRKGFCEKNGDGFFITPEGLGDMGHTT